jgi:hypothetical protein
MPWKSTQPPEVEVVVDTSPEAQAKYLEAIKLLVRRIRARKYAEIDQSGVNPCTTESQPELAPTTCESSA